MGLQQKNLFTVMTEVTAIITTHNRLELLPRALESVLQQTLPPDEIIVVNDGSTDGTQAWLQQQETGVKVINQSQQGISAARNSAIKAANGQWLAFLDDDDSWLPDKLEKQLQAIKANPGYRLCHGEEIWVRNGKRVNAMHKHRKQGGWIFPQCLPLCVISPSATMIHHSVFDDMGLFDENLPACEDYDLWLRFCAIEPVLFIDTPLITKYGGHDDQLSRKYWGMDRFRLQALEKILNKSALREDYRKLTLQMLIEKTSIYLKGVKKRNKTDEAAEYETRLQKYQVLLEQLKNPISVCC